MARKKEGSSSRRSEAKAKADAVTGVGPSPAAAERLNIRLNGGVKAVNDRVGPEIDRASKSSDLVTVPRLDHTLIDSKTGRKYYPSEEPVEIPYNLAVTFGLINMKAGQATGRTTGQTLVTDDDREEPEQADNGQSGAGIPAGDTVPATSVADQAPTLDEIQEAAVAQGTDDESVLAARAAEVEARRISRKEMND